MNSVVRLMMIMAVPTTGSALHDRLNVGRPARTLPMIAPRPPDVARRYSVG
jgi:hypothetical protein